MLLSIYLVIAALASGILGQEYYDDEYYYDGESGVSELEATFSDGTLVAERDRGRDPVRFTRGPHCVWYFRLFKEDRGIAVPAGKQLVVKGDGWTQTLRCDKTKNPVIHGANGRFDEIPICSLETQDKGGYYTKIRKEEDLGYLTYEIECWYKECTNPWCFSYF